PVVPPPPVVPALPVGATLPPRPPPPALVPPDPGLVFPPRPIVPTLPALPALPPPPGVPDPPAPGPESPAVPPWGPIVQFQPRAMPPTSSSPGKRTLGVNPVIARLAMSVYVRTVRVRLRAPTSKDLALLLRYVQLYSISSGGCGPGTIPAMSGSSPDSIEGRS